MLLRKLRIFQLKDLERYGFMSYDFAVKHGFDLNDYECVWEEDINGADIGLEDIFSRFNTNSPKDFKGHSLSVSDIVELDGKKFYCDSTCWQKLN